jgi:hypothetical protein
MDVNSLQGKEQTITRSQSFGFHLDVTLFLGGFLWFSMFNWISFSFIVRLGLQTNIVILHVLNFNFLVVIFYNENRIEFFEIRNVYFYH